MTRKLFSIDPLLPFLCFAFIATIVSTAWAAFGVRGQDLEYHLSSWLEIAANWREGNSFLGWAWHANYGFGDAHLTLYPPLSLLLGTLLTFIFPVKLITPAYTALLIFIAGVVMYYACYPIVPQPRRRLLAAIAYQLSGYLLLTAFFRFAAAELLVQAFLPAVVFHFASWITAPSSRMGLRAGIWFSLLFTLACLTNMPSAIVIVYCTTIVAVAWSIHTRSLEPAVRCALSLVVAVLGAAVYLFPIAIENHWVKTENLNRLDPATLLILIVGHPRIGRALVWGTWLIALLQAGLSLSCFRSAHRSLVLSRPRAVLTVVSLLGGVSFCFMLPLAIPIWHHLPLLQLVSFPFRFMPLLGVGSSLLVATQRKWGIRSWITVSILVFAAYPFAIHINAQRLPDWRSPPIEALVTSWSQRGYPGMPEATPVATSFEFDTGGSHTVEHGGCKIVDLPSLYGVRHAVGETQCDVELALDYSQSLAARVSNSDQSLPTMRSASGKLALSVPASVTRFSIVMKAPPEPSAIGGCLVTTEPYHHFAVVHVPGERSCMVRLPLLAYPYLIVTETAPQYRRLITSTTAEGRLLVNVPNAATDFVVGFQARSALRTIGAIVSALTISSLVVILIFCASYFKPGASD